MKLFSVRDVKAESFGAPMSILTTGLALRGFAEAASDPQSPLHKFPNDYVLYELGEYEPNSGLIIPLSQPRYVVTASGIVEMMEAEKRKSENAAKVLEGAL